MLRLFSWKLVIFWQLVLSSRSFFLVGPFPLFGWLPGMLLPERIERKKILYGKSSLFFDKRNGPIVEYVWYDTSMVLWLSLYGMHIDGPLVEYAWYDTSMILWLRPVE